MKKLKLSDIYKFKIFSNSFSFLELIIYLIYFLLQFFIKFEDKFLMLKYALMILNVLLFSNIITIKLKNFDLFFINNKKNIIKTYIKILMTESLKYGFILSLIFSIKEEFLINNIINIMIYSLMLISLFSIIYILFSNFKAVILVILFIFLYVIFSNYFNNDIVNYFIINIYYVDNNIYLYNSFLYNLLIICFDFLLFSFIFNKKNIIV